MYFLFQLKTKQVGDNPMLKEMVLMEKKKLENFVLEIILKTGKLL